MQHSFEGDAHDDSVYAVTRQDVAPVIEMAKAYADDGGSRPDLKHVAEIPLVVVEKMMQEGSWNDPAALKKWLNDSANKCFRVWPGRV